MAAPATNTTSSAKTSGTPPSRRPFQRPEGLRLLYFVDAGGLFTLMVFIAFVRWGDDWPRDPYRYLVAFALATFVHLLVYYFGGLYERDHSLGSRLWLPRATSLTLFAVLIDAALSVGLSESLMPRLNLAALAVGGALIVAFNRWLAHSMFVVRFGRPRVLLVGNPDDTMLAEEHLEVSDRNAIVRHRVTDTTDLLSAVVDNHITDVLLTSGHIDEIYPHPLDELEARRISVYYRLQSSDTLLGIRRSHQIAGMPFVILRPHAVPPHKLRLKRLIEMVILLLISPVVIVLVALLAIYVRIVGGKGVFYRQDRVGKGGEVFSIVKFRSMYHGAEELSGATKADRDDERVVPWLHWMRQMRFDEIPQLWNVLRGQMSLVGPRPERPELASSYETVIPGYSRRHDIPPGITGLAQVQGGYHTDPGYKLGHDLQYLVNWSPVLDLQILARTIWVILARQV